ncbi:disulfide isomerase [Salpingoeca rosetta]|uniref:Protein disulfide-isomerase n=1 Tax=Salpingoeca rosetta (strain ATCC 50818 / BSB-021) TaxID=946362 RepID=F2UE34_SALR5|nr:disulfide isomerase [Salpingoeca rosetta]EGD74884.1 disulfide isomerase [Salpingoeca rosetta]|eukprot:XP_004992529.1 disulfide isomerase [Salpingoeca rosetta]
MMKAVVRVLALALAVVAVVAASASAYEEEDGVIVATDSNFDDIIKEHEFALVEFYAPWCGHCQALAPEYAKAAQTLAENDSPVKLVKVDCTEQEKLSERYEIRGFPTLRFFRNTVDTDYTGGRTADEIVSWVTKKSGPPAVDVEDVDAAKALAEDNDIVIFGFFDSKTSDEAKAFIDAAGASDNIFGISTNADVAKAYGVSAPAIVAAKQFDEPRVTYEGAPDDAEAINDFVATESLPLVIEFTNENAPKIFGGAVQVHLLTFVKNDHENFEKIVDAMKAAAKDFRGDILFVHIDSSRDDNMRILEYFGLSESDLPAVRIIDLANNMAKYALEGDITADSLHEFASNFKKGSLKRHLMSEETPDDWDAEPVKVLTGNNFADVALDSSKNVFVEFYAPWCGHCKQLAPIWDKLGEKFEGVDNVVIAKLDATANELADIVVESFPTLKLFPADSQEAVDYEGGRTLKELVAFVNDNAAASVEVTAEDEAAAGEGGYDYGEEPEYEDYTEGTGHDEL